jgi:beta-galactosidase
MAIALEISASAAPASPTVRHTVDLSHGWRFLESDVRGAQSKNYVDTSWTPVRLPHTWNRVGYYKPNPADHINHAAHVNKYQGIGWYRLRFTPGEIGGKKVWLEFDAASRTAEVWINGNKIGEHRGGFSRFRFDVTGSLRAHHSNVLAVKVDNSQPAEGSSTSDVLPFVGDFFVEGGLYRPARLVLTDPIHIDMMDYGGPGIYARTASISPANALVAISGKLRNDSSRPAHVSFAVELIDRAGKTAARETRTVDVGTGNSSEVSLVMPVAGPHLWQGVSSPYLYTLRAQVRSSDGRVLDSLDEKFGIRTMRLDPQQGFFLNGKKVRLRGVGLHQDFEGEGWALTDRDVEQSFAIIREMGANTIRLTHYQHGQAIHDLADLYGLILWDEIPLVTAWTLGKNQLEPTAALVANARQQLQELIRQNYNHASVAVWGIANEVDFGPHRPGAFQTGSAVVPDPLPLLRNLRSLAKGEDPTRPTVLANCCEGRGNGIPPVADVVDADGANRYFGWYTGVPSDLGPNLDSLRAKRPWQPLAVTEYGAGAATTVHTDDPLGGPADAGGFAQPEEYQSWVHEQTWPIIASKPYLWSTWLWNAFDFASAIRHEGDSQDLNTKGLVTYDRKTRKDAFYFYKANWTATPTVHINSRRYVERAYPVTDVRVYSNAPATVLRLNGASLGSRTNCPNDVCVWPGVRLHPGRNLFVALGRFRSSTVHDSVEWHLADANARSFRIDSGALVAASSSVGQFGSDAFFQGGKALSVDRGAIGSAANFAAISGSADRDLLATYREGDFRYHVPTGNGRYIVTLEFIEPGPTGDRRLFNVLANGQRVLNGMDVLAAAGHPLTAVERSFEISVTNGALDLHFEPVQGAALVSAIVVTPLGP